MKYTGVSTSTANRTGQIRSTRRALLMPQHDHIHALFGKASMHSSLQRAARSQSKAATERRQAGMCTQRQERGTQGVRLKCYHLSCYSYFHQKAMSPFSKGAVTTSLQKPDINLSTEVMTVSL